ncbi:GNAT family N-acetyltransferase [Cesiribacter andamanensis]
MGLFHPEAQGRGLGSQLLAHRLAMLRQHPEVATIVVRTSQLVYRFYEKGGFTLKEVVQEYWAPGFDLYYMECTNR